MPWNLREWTKQHGQNGGMENAGVDDSVPCRRDALCRSGQISTMWQEWTLQEWSEVTEALYKITRMRGKAQHDGRPAVKWMEAFTRDMGKVRM